MSQGNDILPTALGNETPGPSGTRLAIQSVAGLGLSGAAALLGTALAGPNGGLVAGATGLIVTAAFLIRQVGSPAPRSETVADDSFETLSALVALNRRAIILTDLDGRPLAANEAYEAVSGSRLQPLENLVGADDSTTALAAMRFEALEQDVSEREFPFGPDKKGRLGILLTRSGRYFIWQISQAGLEARLGNLIKSVSAVPFSIFRTLNVGLAIVDADDSLKYANPCLREWLDLDPDEDLPARLRLKNEGNFLITTTNKQVEVDISREAIPHREGEPEIGYFLIVRNLEEQVSVASGNEGHILDDPILDAAPLAVFVVNNDQEIVEYNDAARRLSKGTSLARGAALEAIVSSNEEGNLKRAVTKALTGRPPRRPVDVAMISEHERSGQVFLSSVMVNDKRLAVLYVVENTQQKSLERQFAQAQKMQAVGQLAGGVAHDFNNLLTAILGFCDLLLVRHDSSDQSFADINQIKQNANRAANLVRQLLAFSRQQTLRPKVLNVTDVLAELSNLLRRLIGENIHLNVVHGRDLRAVRVDQGQLEQVIINLAVNARDAMPGGGDLKISTRVIDASDPLIDKYDPIVPAEYVLIEVEDSGTGIAPEILPQIFEPFFTTKDVGQGTGLGLATVYGIVKQTGGYVFVDSAPGKGANFQLFLKAHDIGSGESADKTTQESQTVRDLSGKETILLVEDEDPVRLFASRALTNKGYKVLEAISGEQGLEILQEGNEQIDLMISDVIMPNMDGPTLAAHAREQFPDMPIIFISGYAEDVFRENLQSEDFHFLPKPFSLKDLAEKVKTILSE